MAEGYLSVKEVGGGPPGALQGISMDRGRGNSKLGAR
jgi:hypothetical protein